MLHLQNISLLQFKNYPQATFEFSQRVVGICGNNGMGKTNLLDAIYYLCFTKSYFNKSDAANVSRGMQGMRIEGLFQRNQEDEKVVCIIRENQKKEMQRNGDEYRKLSNHIGLFPAVIIAPDDVELVTGTSEIRRKFLDTLLCQVDHLYMQNLIEYNKVLQQRNSLLKAGAERGYTDPAVLDILTTQLVQPGTYIYKYRRDFLQTFLPMVTAAYLGIAGTNEPVVLKYDSQLHEGDFGNLLATFRQKDMMLQRSTIGIHKDDIELRLHDEVFKNIASQGQRKSLLFALKLQEFDVLKENKHFPPILLLDDVFEKLDEQRMHNLLQKVCNESNCQVFITDTHKDRLKTSLEKLQVQYQLIEL